MIKFTCTKELFRIIHGKIISDTKNTLRAHYFIEKYKLRKYLFGLLSIVIDGTDLETITNHIINDYSNFSNKHIIQYYSRDKSNIP